MCCIAFDDDEGFDICGCIFLGYQFGTGTACCSEDKNGACFALICCECQCDLCCIPEAILGVAAALCCCVATSAAGAAAAAVITTAGVRHIIGCMFIIFNVMCFLHSMQGAAQATAAGAAAAGIIGGTTIGLGVADCCVDVSCVVVCLLFLFSPLAH